MSKDDKKIKRTHVGTQSVSLPLINPNAAGIDIGASLHVVAVPPGRDEVSVRRFGAFTSDLQAIVSWLKDCRIETVAMESTGIYWKNLYAMLVHYGFEVYLVNAKHTRNITGKKDDENDAQWIQRLHSCGLLNTCFLPDEHTDMLRTLVRHRRSLTHDSTRYIHRMQKALESMNIKIHTVINDITGKTGIAILKAIIAGERNATSFISLVDPRIKAHRQDIVSSLEGNWRPEHLFLLKQCYNLYQSIQTQIEICEREIELMLKTMVGDYSIENEKSSKRKTKNQPLFNTREYLKKIHQVDVIDIYGISETSALEILSETGKNLSKWPNDKKFASWLNLCPNNKVSGGKLISSLLMKKKPNAASQAFRMAANSQLRAKNWLGDYFRRMKSKGGQKYAIVATARKIAIIYYKMVRYKEPFKPLDQSDYYEKYKQNKIARLEKALQQLKAA